MRQAFSEPKNYFRCNESSFVGHIMQKIYVFVYEKINLKQSCVWIDSILEAQNICFGSEIAVLLGSFL